MNTLQRVFDRLVGVARYESALRSQAQRIFCAPALNFAPLERPACWRRPARIQAVRQR